jgi:hypothetical protein
MVSVLYDGTPQDFSFTLGDVPIVNARVANILNEMAGNDVQLIPAQIKGHPGRYAVLNVLRSEACVIEGRSMFSEEYWIDAAKAKDAAILRPKGLMLVVLASQHLRDAFVQTKITGVKFNRVSA